MADQDGAFPEFEFPPVIETVLGVQFRPVAGFAVPHFGLYWAVIRQRYPKYEIKPALPPITEQFGQEKWRQLRPRIEVVDLPDVRCWFIDQSGTHLLQVQGDRFIQNWRKTAPDDVYPRYRNTRPRFAEELDGFCQFVVGEGFERPEINQCEITYINHIDLSVGWKSYGELNKVITPWSGEYSGNFLPDPEGVNISARYPFPADKGRLYVEMQPAIRREDAKEILQLTLTARGKPQSSELKHTLDWLDLGHEWIVKGFTDFTKQTMHKLWRRKT